jgi:TPR repeat protein
VNAVMQLQFSHGVLWRADKWYRRAWYAGPQLTAVLIAGWLLSAQSGAGAGGGAGRWGKPVSDSELTKNAEAQLIRAENDAAAAEELKTLADSGDLYAEFEYGVLLDPHFKLPRPTATDVNLALRYYHASALQGHDVAASNYGYYVAFGEGVPKNPAEGLPFIVRAANDNYSVAQTNLGMAYRDGVGVPKNEAVALQWFQKAADQGNHYAEAEIGEAYWNGTAPYPQDRGAAFQWFSKAATNDTEIFSMRRLGEAYRNGQGVAVDIPQALAWFRRAADGGETYSAAEIGFAYWNGTAPYPADPGEAVKWLEFAAKSAHETDAQRVLGMAYRDGRGVVRDPAQARYWFSQAVKNGDAQAPAMLQSMSE